MDTPQVTRDRIVGLKRGVILLFATLAGMLIGNWRADGRTGPEAVKAEVRVKKTNGFQIFEIRPLIAVEGEEAYIKVVGDEDYPKGNLTSLYQPRVRLEPTIIEPDLSLRPVPESPKAATGNKQKAKAIRRTNSRGFPPLPPTNFDFK